MMLIKQLVILSIASIFVFVEGSLIKCSKESKVGIKLVGTLTGQHTRYWQLDVGVENTVCHEIQKQLKYNTVCSYGNISHKCQCSGSWTNEQGLNARIQACDNKLPKQLVECTI